MMRFTNFYRVALTVLFLSPCPFWVGCQGTVPPPPPPGPLPTAVVSSLDCSQCHADVQARWLGSAHANSQADVASELSEERTLQTPNDVLHGDDPEDCIACHGPAAVLANGGMSEVNALNYFFTTSNGQFTPDTSVSHPAEWPNIDCTTCHDVPDDHPASLPVLSLLDSTTGKYSPAESASTLCGQCHGGLRFADTDHLTYNAWTSNKHNGTQADVASELAEERFGQTPDDVVHGDDPENCVACHSPTAVLANGKMTETEALDYFFTTANGIFTGETMPAHGDEWPHVACTACHDPMAPGKSSYFNSSTKEYESMQDASTLCGQCHGNLRFSDTDHLSYNIISGTGGMGDTDHQTMPGISCTDCHMFVSDVDGSNSAMFHGHSFAVTVQEADGTSTTACTHCHETFDTASANVIIDGWKSSFESLDATAQTNVAAAAQAMIGVTNETLRADLEEAQFNLQYAEADESGGVHNHNYLMSLLNDANDKALEILSSLGQ